MGSVVTCSNKQRVQQQNDRWLVTWEFCEAFPNAIVFYLNVTWTDHKALLYMSS